MPQATAQCQIYFLNFLIVIRYGSKVDNKETVPEVKLMAEVQLNIKSR